MVTIREIAKLAGVSPTTVSRVLNNSRAVQPEICERVLQVAAQMGYTPNAAARALVKKGTNAIGVVVNNLHDPFFHDLLLGFEYGALKSDYHVVFCSALGKSMEEKRKYVRYLSNGVVDGVILYSVYLFDEEFIRGLYSTGFPILLIENTVQAVQTHSIAIDNRQGVFNAMKYLYQHGHRQISYIAGKQDKAVCVDRLLGYRRAVEELGLAARSDYVRYIEEGSEDGWRVMDAFLSMPPDIRPTAVLCYDDVVASYAIRCAIKRGVRVPDDISVMGFDNQTIAPSEYTGPPITSVAQPLYEIGYDSIVLLSDYLRGDRRERISRTYPTSIAVKETVAFCGKEGFDKERGGVPSAVWVGSDSRE
ncbi:MAG: LacI family transcriptional regulator [Clostridiales bacterium]|nr:LacI family transcriptional regulator [Clostridiales bacterium]